VLNAENLFCRPREKREKNFASPYEKTAKRIIQKERAKREYNDTAVTSVSDPH
jgi:hypothetical protein